MISQNPEDTYDALNKYGTDLVDAAKERDVTSYEQRSRS